MKIIKKISIVFSLILLMASCDDTYSPPPETEKVYTLNLNLSNFPKNIPNDLNLRNYLWVSKKGENKYIFLKSFLFLRDSLHPSRKKILIKQEELIEEDIDIIITVEESYKKPSEPSNWILCKGSGNLSSNPISLSFEDGLFNSENESFLNSKASFFLNAPSAGSVGGNHNGIWFINDLSATTGGFENFPVLGENWEYGAWILLDDNTPADNIVHLPIGKFTNISQADTSIYGTSFNNEFKGANSVYPFVGEDFIEDPNGKFSNLDFPLDLRRPSTVLNSHPNVIITIRPKSYENTTHPFFIWIFDKHIGINESLSEKIIMNNRNQGVNFSGKLSLIPES
ncbi:hypothetical protein [Tenacibaculum sp. C7A-26P2]|uniref:hypothetical protein n=1 Tax=Tenacibaculum sp. C7A-26P2 TaxID=3447504 RepID=UPI003F83C4C6